MKIKIKFTNSHLIRWLWSVRISVYVGGDIASLESGGDKEDCLGDAKVGESEVSSPPTSSRASHELKYGLSLHAEMETGYIFRILLDIFLVNRNYNW